MRCAADPIRDGLRVTATLRLPLQGPQEFAVLELAGAPVWVSPADTSREGSTLTAIADMVPQSAKPFALDRSAIRITVFGGARPVEIMGCQGG